MSALKSFDTRANEVIDAIAGRSLPSAVRGAAAIGIVWGLAAFLYALFAGDARWGWGAFLVATFYTLGLAQGGVIFAAVLQVTRAHWGRPIKRIAETFALVLPVVWVALALVLCFGIDSIYVWSPNFKYGEPVSLLPHYPTVPAMKVWWFGQPFYQARELLGLAALIGLDLVFLRNSLRPDLIAAKARLGAQAPAWWDKIIGGATNATALSAATEETNYRVGVMMVWGHFIVITMLAFDVIMSLSPWWYANMFGGWIFMSMLWVGMCTVGAFAMIGRDWLGLKSWVTPKVTHDLGQLMLAGCMFWAYTFFAQLLPIYYTNMPEETDFLLVRLMLPEWSWMAQLVGVLCFLTPLTILLSRAVKKLRWPFLAICLIILTGNFFERTLLVMPQVYFGDTFPAFEFLFVSVGIGAGFLGTFVLIVGSALAKLPAVPVTDERLKHHPWDVHVHAAPLRGAASSSSH